MIYLITGLPGASKTLYTLHRVTTDTQLVNREVHYHGIPDLMFPWIKMSDPKKWFEVPEGSVIVIDECQKVFPLRSVGSAVPQWVSEFETHRHRNLDIVLITQDSKLLDAHVRKLVERHFHLKRPFGLDYATVHEFHGVGDPGNGADLKQALKTRFKHPKELFGKYKSATGHSVKKRVPLKLFVLPLALAFVVFCGLKVYTSFKSKAPGAEVAKSASKGATSEALSTGSGGAGGVRGLPRDLPAYMDVLTPRDRANPSSAPLYDGLVQQVKQMPMVVGCLWTKEYCECYSQQGTVMPTSKRECVQIVRNGRFNPYADRRDGPAERGSAVVASTGGIPSQ